MKKVILLFFAFGVSLAAFFVAPVSATRPTVTTTLTTTMTRQLIYTFSFTTDDAAVDTAIVSGVSLPLNVFGFGNDYMDRYISLELSTTETTADSVRFTILTQFSNATTPTITAAGGASGTDWWTAYTDSVSFNNAGAVTGAISKVSKVQVAGQAKWVRWLFIENNGTVLDADQTITGRIVLPRRDRVPPDAKLW